MNESFATKSERFLFRISERRDVRGVKVAVFTDDDLGAEAFARIQAAFDLLEQHVPVRLGRLRRDADAVFVWGVVGDLANWVRALRLIRLRASWVRHPSTSPVQIASTLVHEATHAYLERLGFSYHEHRRAQIERICVRSELVLLRRIGDEEGVVDAERRLTTPAEVFSQAAFQQRAEANLKKLGPVGWAFLFFARLRRLASEPVAVSRKDKVCDLPPPIR
jgi:hypothetical protein